MHRTASVIFAVAGDFIIIRSFAAKEFFLAPWVADKAGLRVNWLARSLAFLMGLGALALAVGLWGQA